MCTGMCGCQEPRADQIGDIDVPWDIQLGMGDSRESDASNYILGVHKPVLRGPLGGPAEAPSPEVPPNASVTCVLEAKTYYLRPFYLYLPSEVAAEGVYIDEGNDLLNTGYFGADEQTV